MAGKIYTENHTVSAFNKKKSRLKAFINISLLLSFLSCTFSVFFIGQPVNEQALRAHSIAGSIFGIVTIIHLIGKRRYLSVFLNNPYVKTWISTIKL
ncbi:MAG: hypothetical protein Q8920_11245 [Bacillota bacterium]|nr:hypothetical protein [Bacillota bacterium]